MFSPDSQPWPYLGPTGITAPTDPQLYTIVLCALPSVQLNNRSIKKTLFQPLNCIFFNWNLLYARLSSHYEAGSYKKKKHKKIKAYRKSVSKETTVKSCTLILDLKPFRSWAKGKHFIGREFQNREFQAENLKESDKLKLLHRCRCNIYYSGLSVLAAFSNFRRLYKSLLPIFNKSTQEIHLMTGVITLLISIN